MSRIFSVNITISSRHSPLRFLVAADITAFAAGAEGGEHSQRVERALLFACLGEVLNPGVLEEISWP